MKLMILSFMLIMVFLATRTHRIVKPTPKYLVQVKDTIYHCEEVTKTPCGLYISCGKDSFYCASNVIVEDIP